MNITQNNSDSQILNTLAKSKVDTKSTLYQLLSFAGPERMKLVMAFSALLMNSVTTLSFPWIMGQAVDRATGDDPSKYYLFLAGTSGIFGIGAIASCVRIYCLGTATDNISNRFRSQLFNCFIKKDVTFFDSSTTGEIITLIDKDVEIASLALTEKLASGLRSLNSAINGSILLFLTSPQLCLVSLSVVPFVGIGAMSISKYSRALSNKLLNTNAETLNYSIERFENISTIKLNYKETDEMIKYSKLTEKHISLSKQSHLVQGSLMSFLNISTNISLMIILVVGGGLLVRKQLTPGQLTRFAMQSAFVGLGFSGLSSFTSEMIKSLASAKRIFDILDSTMNTQPDTTSITSTVPTSSTSTTATSLPVLPPGPLAIELLPAIELKNVTFHYPTRTDSIILDHVTVSIPTGSLIAFVGQSGAGKSTLCKIITGLLRPSQGDVTIFGVDTKGIEDRMLREQIGVVEQNPGIFSGTIAYNIQYGRVSTQYLLFSTKYPSTTTGSTTTTATANPSIQYLDSSRNNSSNRNSSNQETYQYSNNKENCNNNSSSSSNSINDYSYCNGNANTSSSSSDDENMDIDMVDAAVAAGIHTFIDSLPEKYNTQVGVGGKLLSGGQKARIAIARALIRHPSILVLDEATAALDSENELAVIQALRRYAASGNKTVIAFTHSEAVVRSADIIHVLVDGKIVNSGNYNELITRNSLLVTTLNKGNGSVGEVVVGS